MKLVVFLALAATAHGYIVGPSLIRKNGVSRTTVEMAANMESTDLTSRRDALFFVSTVAAGLTVLPGEAQARGRATQIKSWSRYGARVEGMRGWIAGSLKGMIKTADYAGIKEATEPKKGVMNTFLTAMDLWAATYSDASISPKTNAMMADNEALRTVQKDLYALSQKALGEEVKKSGGFLGIGAKEKAKPTAAELNAEYVALFEKAKAAYNDYCELNNVGRPFEIDELMEV